MPCRSEAELGAAQRTLTAIDGREGVSANEEEAEMTEDDRRARAVIPESVTGTAERYRYSPGIVVPAGELLFVSGQVGRDATGTVVLDPERQFATAFENLDAVLTAAGTTLAHVVELTTYHTAMEHLALFAEVKARFLASAPYPAWSAIGVHELALPGLLVEIKATATL